jgi:hypothetical protein
LWVKEGDEFDEEEIKIFMGAEVTKVISYGKEKEVVLYPIDLDEESIKEKIEDWASNVSLSGHFSGYELEEGVRKINHAKIKGPCGHWH